MGEFLQSQGVQPSELLPWFVGVSLGMLSFAIGLIASRGTGGRSPAASYGDSDQPPDDADPWIVRARFFGSQTWLLARIIPDILQYKVHRDLLRSGYLHPHAYDNYLALRNVMVLGLFLSTACWLVAVADDDNLARATLIAGGVAAPLVYALPRMYLNWRGDRRAEQILIGLPDALDVVVMSLTGGMSLQASLHRASAELQQAHSALAGELIIVKRQTELGSLEQALTRFAQRVDLDEVTTLAAIVSHAEQLGANVGAVLREYADGLRTSRMQRIRERSNRISIQMLFPIVLCLGPAAFIVLLTPLLLDLRDFRDRGNRAGGALVQPDLEKASRTPRPPSPARIPQPTRNRS